jgi:hypothetical protein
MASNAIELEYSIVSIIEVWCFSVAHEVENTMDTINNLQNETKDN